MSVLRRDNGEVAFPQVNPARILRLLIKLQIPCLIITGVLLQFRKRDISEEFFPLCQILDIVVFTVSLEQAVFLIFLRVLLDFS